MGGQPRPAPGQPAVCEAICRPRPCLPLTVTVDLGSNWLQAFVSITAPRTRPQVMGHITRGLQDAERNVRGAAAMALGMASEFLQPEIVVHYKEVRPPSHCCRRYMRPGRGRQRSVGMSVCT